MNWMDEVGDRIKGSLKTSIFYNALYAQFNSINNPN